MEANQRQEAGNVKEEVGEFVYSGVNFMLTKLWLMDDRPTPFVLSGGACALYEVP